MALIDQLHNRTITSFGLSIGTGLALESIFDPTQERYDNSRVIPNIININDYTYHYINIFTIIRNILNASSLLDVKQFNFNYTNTLLLEIIQIETGLINSLYENTKCKVIFLIPRYKFLISRLSKTRNINQNNNYIENIKILNLYNYIVYNINMLSSVCSIKLLDNYDLSFVQQQKNLITTHLGIDLCYKNIDLLESHTGVLKKEKSFNSKYIKLGKNYDMSILPYNEILLSVFGDKSLIPPMNRELRLKAYELSKKKWSLSTGKLKIRSDLKQIGIKMNDLI